MGRIKDLILAVPDDPLVQPYFAYMDQLEFQLSIEPSEYAESVPVKESVLDYDEDVPF